MATRKQLVERAREVGATLDWGDTSFNVDSPRGMVWNATGTSTLYIVITAAGGGRGEGWTAEAYDDALDLMEHGVSEAAPDYEGWWS